MPDILKPFDVKVTFQNSAAVGHAELVQLAMNFAINAFKGFQDKNDDSHDSTMVDHTIRVDRYLTEALKGKISGEELNLRRAVCFLHDYLELSHMVDGQKQRVRSLDDGMRELSRAGFSQRVINAVLGTTIYLGEPYLDFIRRCANDPVSLDVKLFGDLKDHKMRKDKEIVIAVSKKPSQLFLDKTVGGLYDMSSYYLAARRAGRIGDISVAEFIMKDTNVPAHLKHADVLRRNSSPCTKIPCPNYFMGRTAHRVVDRFNRWFNDPMLRFASF